MYFYSIDQDKDERHPNGNLIAYPPIPKCFIKEEDDDVEESQIIAYPPIPRSAAAMKEELMTDHEEMALEIHEVIK